MPLIACANCGRRYATEVITCRRCGHLGFAPSPVTAEPALIEAVTVLHVGVPSETTLVVAGLSDLAVLARSVHDVAVGENVQVSDVGDGGFAVLAVPAATGRPERAR
jgi:hypothetical protein